MVDAVAGTEAARGLATVALLKVNFDAGGDHIGMFEPFVVDTLCSTSVDGVTADELRGALNGRHRLALPLNTLRTLLGRLTKRGLLRRDGGRYFRTAKTPYASDLLARVAEVEDRQRRLGEELVAAGGNWGVDIGTPEEALALVLTFLEAFHVAVALDDKERFRPLGGDGLDAHRSLDEKSRVTARFIYENLVDHTSLADIIQEMLEGFVLQNALLLKDISTAGRRFQSLYVYFDSQILFRALGHTGSAAEIATLEFISLLRDTGATLNIFEPTLREMRAILHVYEEKLGTARGRASLYPTDMTRHFLRAGATPSDVRQQSALLAHTLTQLGFNIREVPKHEARYTLDEQKLGKLLGEGRGNERSHRVLHDVDCVAGVLTSRRGSVSDSWDTARAVFVSSNSATIDSVVAWYGDEEGKGLPPIVHYLYLSNLAWLKKPASAAKLKVNELVALCAAALRPSRAGWNRFLDHLRKLEASGALASDEVTAILANGLTDSILFDAAVDEDSDAASLNEVVERVKETYRQEATAEVAAARRDALAQAAVATRVQTNVRTRATSLGRAVAWALSLLIAGGFATGSVISLISASGGTVPGLLPLLLAAVPLTLGGLASLLWGFHLMAWRAAVEERVSRSVARWLLGAAQV